MEDEKNQNSAISSQGKIIVLIGPMCASKSSKLRNYLSRYSAVEKRIVRIGHSLDKKRSNDPFPVRNQEYSSTTSFETLCVSSLSEVDVSDKIIIGIDEGQFFENLKDFCLQWKEQGKIVIVSALDFKFTREPFEEISKLIIYANKVKKMTALCRLCYNETHLFVDAPFTAKTCNRDQIIEITESFEKDTEMWVPCCEKHWEILMK